MWWWERKAYARGFDAGRGRGIAESIGNNLTFDDPVDVQINEAIDKERKASDARVEEQYRQLGQLLWEARREIPDDSPMHARIRKALDHSGGMMDAQMRRIEKMFPGSVKPLEPR